MCSIVSGRSATRATASGLPLSSDSSCANSSRCFSIRSASFQIIFPRTAGEVLDQGPVWKAARAAFTARSISSRSPSATFASTSPVAGLYVAKVFPEAASTHLPLMRSFCFRATKLETFESIDGAVTAVAIDALLYNVLVESSANLAARLDQPDATPPPCGIQAFEYRVNLSGLAGGRAH